MDMFISAVEIKRYRGSIMINMREISKEYIKCFSWIYRKYDVYSVGVDDGYCLYELGKGNGKNRWFEGAQLTGHFEKYK